MTGADVDMILRRFQRRMIWSIATRWTLGIIVAAYVFVIIGPLASDRAAKLAPISMLLLVAGWMLLVMASARMARALQTTAALMALGQWAEAEQELARVWRGFTIFSTTLLMACQQLGTLLRARRDYAQASRVLRTVLQFVPRRRAMRAFERTVRLLLADVELELGNLSGAYDAFRPVFGAPLSLAERLLLLPIELRYELASGHTQTAVTGLPDKVRHAELLEAPQAARVHAMLAEACQREGLTAQADYLRRRSALYHDPDSLPAHLSPRAWDTDAGVIA